MSILISDEWYRYSCWLWCWNILRLRSIMSSMHWRETLPYKTLLRWWKCLQNLTNVWYIRSDKTKIVFHFTAYTKVTAWQHIPIYYSYNIIARQPVTSLSNLLSLEQKVSIFHLLKSDIQSPRTLQMVSFALQQWSHIWWCQTVHPWKRSSDRQIW